MTNREVLPGLGSLRAEEQLWSGDQGVLPGLDRINGQRLPELIVISDLKDAELMWLLDHVHGMLDRDSVSTDVALKREFDAMMSEAVKRGLVEQANKNEADEHAEWITGNFRKRGVA